MERYDLTTTYWCGAEDREMLPSLDGDWVRYEDYIGVEVSNRELARLLKQVSGDYWDLKKQWDRLQEDLQDQAYERDLSE